MNILNIIDEDGNLIPIPALQGPPGEQGKPGGTAELDDNVIAPDKIWSSEKIDYEIKNSSGGSHSGVSSITQDNLDGHTLNIVTDGIESSITIPVPTTLPASDVYDWAKEAEKPIYTAEEVGAAEEQHTHMVSDISDFPTALPASDVYDWAKADTKPAYSPSEIGAAYETHTHSVSDISDFPSSMPASDVYDWAKAATKPSYTASEVGACSSNDSRLSNSRPASDVYAWAKASSKPSYTASEVGAAASSHNHANIGAAAYVQYPSGGQFYTSTSQYTGYLKITLPQSWTSTMLRFKISIYEYTKNASSEYIVGGYNYNGGTWESQPFAYSRGYDSKSNLTVRLGHDGSKCAIYIGESTTKWSYPQIAIHDVVLGYSGYEYSKWATGWGIGFTTTLGTVTATITNPGITISGYKIEKSVPSNAVFTDTNTWRPLGTGASDACAGNDSRLSNSRPASDVYSWAKASAKPSYAWSEITSKPSSFTPAAHNQAASTITAGTLGGKVNANATAAATLENGQVRDITISTTDLTAGSSALTTGAIYMVYE